MKSHRIAATLLELPLAFSGRPEGAETHRFVPDHFYNTYSAAHPAALRIRPGDRVATKTVDAAGVDADGKTVASPSNPQTGPFFVEGAEPDDMLVVTFVRIEPNRAPAYSGRRPAPTALHPRAIASRPNRGPRWLNCNIDKPTGEARLEETRRMPGP